MRVKNRYLYLEAVLTFFLLLLAVFVFREDVFKDKAYIVSGLLCCFSIGWSIRNNKSRKLKSFITVGTLAGLIWTAYSILNSSFLYEEVMLICLKGVLVLEFILALGAWSQPFLSYIQALSVILFVSHPIFFRKPYDLVSLAFVAAYIIVWFFVLRFKFYGFLKEPAERNRLIYFPLSAFLISILIFSLTLFLRFPFSGSKWAGAFYDETFGGQGVTGEKKEGSSKKYYDLQDKVQEGVVALIPSLDSFDARQETIFLLSLLIKEPSKAIEAEKAETGLMERLKTRGPGLEEKEMRQLSVSINSYVDKKIELNLDTSQREISKFLGRQPFNIKDRFSILPGVNKLRRAATLQKLNEQQKGLKKNIESSSLDSESKAQLNSLARKIKEWKIFEMYRKALGDLEKDADSLDDRKKKEFNNFISEVKHSEDPGALKEAVNRLSDFKQTTPANEDIPGLKLEMLLEAEEVKLKEKTEGLDLSENETKKLKEDLADLMETQDYEDFSQEAQEFEVKIEIENLDVSGEAADLLIAKAYSLERQKEQEFANILGETALSETQKEAFLDRLRNMDSTGTSESLDSDAAELKTDIEQFVKQGSISKQMKDSLIKGIDELKGILLHQKRLEEGSFVKYQVRDTSARNWKKMVNEASLREEAKDAFRRLVDELSVADSFSELKDIQQAVEKEITTGETVGTAGTAKGAKSAGEKYAGATQASGVAKAAGTSGGSGVVVERSGIGTQGQSEGVSAGTDGKGKGKGEGEGGTEKGEGEKPSEKSREGEKKSSETSDTGETGKKELKTLKEAFSPLVEAKKELIKDSALSELRKSMEELKIFDSQSASALDDFLSGINLDSTEEEFENVLNNLYGETALIEAKIQREERQKKESAYRLSLVKNLKSSLGKTKKKLALARKKKLISIRINPGNLSIHFGEKGQFRALGVYSDNKEKDLTSFVEWISLNKEVAGVFRGTVYTRFPGETKIYASLRQIESLPVPVIVKEPRLVSIILSPQDLVISMKGKLEIKVEGYFSDGSRKDIASFINWNISGPRIIRLKDAFVEPLRIGETQLYAKYLDITSLPVRIRVIFTAGWLMGLIFKWGTYFMFAVLTMFLVLYFITRHKARKLLLFYKNPRSLTIKLYENAKKIISIFGLKGEGALSPRSYAKLVEKTYGIKNNLFLNFTVKFEEASYSRHLLGPDTSALILEDYNGFLKLLLGKYNRINLFLRYCRALLHRSPLFIKTP